MAVPVTAALPINRYHQFYNTDEHDPYAGEYSDLLREFRVIDIPPTSESLFDLVRNADTSYPAAYLTLISEQGQDPYFLVLHSVSSFPRTMGRPTPWDGKTFATVGEVHDGNVTLVEFPQDAFGTIPAAGQRNVPATLARGRELLAANPRETLVGPFADGTASITQVQSRWMTPLPHRYVNIFLGDRKSLREGYVDLSLAMEVHEDDRNCTELRDWLLLAITRSTAGANSSLARSAPIPPLADRILLGHRKTITTRHLPGLYHTPPAGLEVQQRLVNTVTELAEQHRLARVEATEHRLQDSAPKTVAKALGQGVTDTLLAICQVEAEAQLPSFWREVAVAGKRDRQALEQALLAKSRTNRMAEAAPVATPDLTKKVVNLQWAGLSADDLSEGIQPFSVVVPEYVGSEAGVEAQRLADTYDIMVGTGTTSTLEDARSIKGSKPVIPVDFSEARAHLVALMILWTVLLGEEHPFVLAFGAFLRGYTTAEYSYKVKLQGLGTQAPPAALLLRYVQLRSVTYWRKALATRTLPPPPPFEELLDRIDMHDASWLPRLPLKYWKPIEKPSFLPSTIVSGLTPSSVLSGIGGSKATSSNPQGGGSTGGSMALGDSSGGSTTGGDRSSQAPARNPSLSPVFAPYQEQIKATTIKAAMAKAGPPPTVVRDGKPLQACLSYHLKGMCWSGCARSGDHGPHTEAEDNEILNWCQAAYAS